MEAAIQNRTTVLELSFQHIGTRVVESNALISHKTSGIKPVDTNQESVGQCANPRDVRMEEEANRGGRDYLVPGRNEQMIAVVREPNVGNSVRRRI